MHPYTEWFEHDAMYRLPDGAEVKALWLQHGAAPGWLLVPIQSVDDNWQEQWLVRPDGVLVEQRFRTDWSLRHILEQQGRDTDMTVDDVQHVAES